MASLNEHIKVLPDYSQRLIKLNRRLIRQDEAASEARWALTQQLNERQLELKASLARLNHEYEETGATHLRAMIADAETDLADLQQEIREHQSAQSERKSFIDEDELQKWLRNNRKTKWKRCEPQLKIKKHQNAKEALNTCQKNVDDTRAELKAVRNAPLPLEDAKAKLKSTLEKRALQGTPDTRGLMRLLESEDGRLRQGDIAWPQGHTSAGDWLDDAFSFFVWAQKDFLIEKLGAEMAANARPGAISMADRPKKIAEINTRILKLERLEEAAFLLASQDDPNLKRRKISFEALLQIEPQTTASAAISEFN